LYGVTVGGGPWSYGTVFSVNTDGTGFSTLYSFRGGSDGGNPVGGLCLMGDALYGATSLNVPGGGIVFSLPVPAPPLKMIDAGDSVVLAWPTNESMSTVLEATNLGSSTLWVTNTSPRFVINGWNTLTNPISGTRRFYRLSQ